MIELVASLTLQEYKKLNFTVAYKQPLTLFISLVGIANITVYFCFYLE